MDNLSRQKGSGAYTLSAFVAVCLWALSPVSIHSLSELPPFQLTSMILASSFFSFWFFRLFVPEKNKKPAYPSSKKTWVLGCTCIFLVQYLYTASFYFLAPEQAEVTYYAWPFMLTLFCVFSKISSFSIIHFASLIICFTGIYTCLSPQGSYPDQDSYSLVIGTLLCLGGAFTWAYYSFYCKRYKHLTTDSQSSYFSGPCALIALALHLGTESFTFPTIEQVGLTFFLGTMIINISLILWKKSLRYGNFKLITLFPYLVPILSVFFLVLAGKTTLSSRLILSAVLVSLGTILPKIIKSSSAHTETI